MQSSMGNKMILKLFAGGGTNGKESCGAMISSKWSNILDAITAEQPIRTWQDSPDRGSLRRWSWRTCWTLNILCIRCFKVKHLKLFVTQPPSRVSNDVYDAVACCC